MKANRRKFIAPALVLLVLALGATGYLAIDHYGLEALISLISVYGVAGIIFAESGLLVGFFLPGDSLLFTAGFLVHQGILLFNIHLLAVILFVAAALGDSTGYAFGRRVGRRLFNRKDSLLFHKENILRAEAFYERHGGKTIILARFIPVIRTFAPIVAGVGKMKYRTFIAYNLIGALLWAAGLTYLGYFAGTWIEAAGINIEYVIIGIILLSVMPPIIHVLRDASARQQLLRSLRHMLRQLRG